MRMTKKETMKTKTDEELTKLVAETRAVLRNERFAAAGARAKDPNAPRKLKKTIARILTEQHTRRTSVAASVSSGSRPAI